MTHLDAQVDDLDAAVADAARLGVACSDASHGCRA